jgi:uncharacterized protein YjiS (DUF1127 family)
MVTTTSTVLAGRRVAPRPANTTSKSTIKTPAASGAPNFARLPLLWLQRLSWRAELKALDAVQMRDCGLDPADVAREAMKPFWRD